VNERSHSLISVIAWLMNCPRRGRTGSIHEAGGDPNVPRGSPSSEYRLSG
jgi:hypothetical protein